MLAVLLVAGAISAQGGAAAVPSQPAPPPAAMVMAQGDGSKMAGCMATMAGKQAAQKTLDGLVTRMNAAQGATKIEAITAVINELVAQQQRMAESMTSMHGSMMPPATREAEPKAPTAGVDHDSHHQFEE
jgi:hypothetical protein